MNAAQFFRGFTSTAAVLVFMLVGSAVASGHIQVRPAVVAPGDAAEFTVLVPGERDPAWTTRVELKLPVGLLPFSYGETPGWKRSLIKASNGRVDRIIWTGRLAPDGFVVFSFLAGTPDQPGLLTWKADVQRWRGVPLDWRTIRRFSGRDNQGGGRCRGPEFRWRVWHGCRGGDGASRVDEPRLVAAGSRSGRVGSCDCGTGAHVAAASPDRSRCGWIGSERSD